MIAALWGAVGGALATLITLAALAVYQRRRDNRRAREFLKSWARVAGVPNNVSDAEMRARIHKVFSQPKEWN